MTRILIVEDEQHLADGLRFNLEAECYDTEVVDTGEAALDRLRVTDPPVDLMVLDVMLPGLNGFQVATHAARAGLLRAHPDAHRARAGRRRREGVRGRRRRLPAQAVRSDRPHRAHWRAASPSRVGPPPQGCARPGDACGPLRLRRARDRFCRTRAAARRPHSAADADGGQPPSLSGPARGTGGLPQRHSRAGLGRTRRHRHPRHRQLRCAPAPPHRRRRGVAEAPADRAQRRLPLHRRAAEA